MAFSSRVPFVDVRKRASVCWSSSSINKDPESALRIEKVAGHGILSYESACSSFDFDVAICCPHPMLFRLGVRARAFISISIDFPTYPSFPLFLTHEER